MRCVMILTLALLGAGLAGCGGDDSGGGSSGYSYRPTTSYQRPPSYTLMPSQRSTCGTGRNFC